MSAWVQQPKKRVCLDLEIDGTMILPNVKNHLRDTLSYPEKGKAVLLQAWSGPEGSRKLRFPDFMKMEQDGGEVVSFTHWPPLLPGNTPGTHFC